MKGTVILCVITVAAVLIGLALVGLLPLSEAGLTRSASVKLTLPISEDEPRILQCFNYTWRWGFGKVFARGFSKGLARIEVSDEFKSNVVKIIQNDFDVAKLLEEGYNVTRIEPILTATVTSNGEVSWKATKAIVTLVKNQVSFAEVIVDIEQDKVTKIVTLTRNIIKKE